MKKCNIKELLTVQQLAKIFKISTQTIHYYDREKLLVPTQRDENQYRKYDYHQIYELSKICYLRKINFSIKQIRHYQSCHDYTENIALLKAHANKLQHDYEELLKNIAIVTEKTQYLESTLQSITLGVPTIVAREERYYQFLGDETFAAHNDLFFLYQTIVHYQANNQGNYDISFSCRIPLESKLKHSGTLDTIPSGNFIEYYHKGSYATVGPQIDKLKRQFSHYKLSEHIIVHNIVDQFVENNADKYIVCIEIPIIA